MDKSIRAGNFATWPSLSIKAVNNHFPEYEETQKGHMKGQRQGVKSTKTGGKEANQKDSETPQTPMQKKNDVYYNIIDLKETIYTDQTGQCPHLSSKGNRYIMVAIHIDTNYIAMEPMKNRTEMQIITAY